MGVINAKVGIVARVSIICMRYRLLEFCGLCLVLSKAFSVNERVANALKGRADYFNALISMECVLKQVFLVFLACNLIILFEVFNSRF